MAKITGALTDENVIAMYTRGETNEHKGSKFDVAIQSALAARGIVEIYGPSGAGKSTLALQILASSLSANDNFRALYISTDSVFCTTRLWQIFGETTEERFLACADRLIVQHLGDLESQDHFFNYFLENLVYTRSISMVVVDSISANFRVSPRAKEYTQSLYRSAFVLRNLTIKYGCRVICLNQVTASISEHSNSPILAQSAHFRPALGLSWMNCVTTRILIKKDDRHGRDSRTIDIIFSPSTASASFVCVMDNSGLSNFSRLTGDRINGSENDFHLQNCN